MNAKYIVIREGKVDLLIPNPVTYLRSDGVIEPSWAPVFYNHVMVMNRDIAVLLVHELSNELNKKALILDALAGTGVRALRICKESSQEINCIANDISLEALKLIRTNIDLNKMSDRITALNYDANELMYKLSNNGVLLDYIDIDPFGSPAPFIRSALQCVRSGGIIALTATDVASLNGTKWWAGSRRYDLKLRRSDIGDEVGIRALLGYIARRAAELDKYIEPLISYKRKYYYRIYIRVSESAKKSDEMLLNNVKYLLLCNPSGKRIYVDLDEIPKYTNLCPSNNDKTVVIGPLWVSNTADSNLINKLLSKLVSDYKYLQTYSITKELLSKLKMESELKYTYNVATISRFLHTDIPKVEKLIECLKSSGYKATKAHYEGPYVKTDATWNEVVSCIKTLRSGSGGI